MKQLLILSAFFVFVQKSGPVFPAGNKYPEKDSIIELPLGGNSFAINAGRNERMIGNAGIENWTKKEVSFDSYLRVSRPGTLNLAITAKSTGESRLQIAINKQTHAVTVSGNDFKRYDAGEWNLTDTGYVKITLSGLSKTGDKFGDLSSYQVSGTAIDAKTAYVKNNEGNFFYWGRRGPSVHLNYPFDENLKAKYFYNEVTVPEGQDVIGSYFMSIGFGEGYFGIQVNSSTERRILFSVWSPFTTDDPKSIPADMRISMLKKGSEVYTGEFGNEGSGGQSYLRYNWKAGNTYRFLLSGEPDGSNNTTYTAWFFAPEKAEWKLIASFKRPKTSTTLKRFHSFLENFSPEQGDKERSVHFGNQWVADAAGNWTELTRANFTYDNTAAKGYRMDFAGGVEKDQFFLKNCGFFSAYTPYRSSFVRAAQKKQPVIEFKNLL
jgi:hypothetical protein